MAQYELLLLGSPSDAERAAMVKRMASIVRDFEMDSTTGLAVRTVADVDARDPKAATAALYFGGDPNVDIGVLATLLADRIPVIPVLTAGAKVDGSIPASLKSINVCFVDPHDTGLQAVAALAQECLGLLHEQRRVFVSYRRLDSREVAIQLHDELSARGFDVFLDTHSIRPGAVFQEMLWHRLADCDVVVMLDTAGYFDSRWTTQEFGRTQAHGIGIVQLVWPEHTPTSFVSLSDTVRLDKADFAGSDRLRDATVATVIAKTEALRSRSIAARQRNLVAKLRQEVLSIGGAFGGVGAYHAVPVDLRSGLKVLAYPAVGVPTALLLNEISRKASGEGANRRPCLVYDDTGLGPTWLEHLAWLDKNISGVKAIKVAKAGWELVGWQG